MVSEGRHYNKLGIFMTIQTSTQKESSYKVLVLNDPSKDEIQQNRNDLWHRMMSFSHSMEKFLLGVVC